MGKPSDERPPALKCADSPTAPLADLSEYSPNECNTNSGTPVSQFAYTHLHSGKVDRKGQMVLKELPATAEQKPSPTAHFIPMHPDVSCRSSLSSLGFSRSDVKKHYAPIWYFLIATILSMFVNLLGFIGIFFVPQGESRWGMYSIGCFTGSFIQDFILIAFDRFILQ